jgi:DNA replication protein DnaC
VTEERTREQIIAEKTWTCPDCGEPVPPLELENGDVIRRRFCLCPAGREKEEEMFAKPYLHEAQRNRWIDESHLKPHLTFQNYEGAQKTSALAYTKKVLAGANGWLWIHGPTGTHKHHLANAIGMLVVNHSKKDPRVRYLDWSSFCTDMSDEWDDGPNLYRHQFREARKAGLLILVQVGQMPRFAWAVRRFVDLISYRSREDKPTVFVSALPFQNGESSLHTVLKKKGDLDMGLLVDQWVNIFDRQIKQHPNGMIIYTGRR